MNEWCIRTLTDSSSFISQLKVVANRTCIQSSPNTRQNRRRRRLQQQQHQWRRRHERNVTLCYEVNAQREHTRWNVMRFWSRSLSSRKITQWKFVARLWWVSCGRSHICLFSMFSNREKKAVLILCRKGRITVISLDRDRKRRCFNM